MTRLASKLVTSLINVSKVSTHKVYVDGACSMNGKHRARAGIGVFWGDNDDHNLSLRLKGRQTNQRAEIESAVMALKQSIEKGLPDVEIVTDSQYVFDCVTKYMSKWKKDENAINAKDFRRLDLAMRKFGKSNVCWTKVAAHSDDYGNDQADKLAKIGAAMKLKNNSK